MVSGCLYVAVVHEMNNEDNPLLIERLRLADETNRIKSPDENDDVLQYYQTSAEAGDVHAQVGLTYAFCVPT